MEESNTLIAKLKKKKTALRLSLLALVLIVLPALLGTGAEYLTLVMGLTIIYIIAVSGLDIVFGYCGQISMGHAAFYAIGAYGSAIMAEYLKLPIMLTMFLAALLAAAIGAIIAYPASKLVFHFLSLSTVAFGEIVYLILTRSPGNITNNYLGLFTKNIDLFGFVLNTPIRMYYFGLVMLALFLLYKQSLINSKIGRAFQAIRENTHAANGMGINVRKYKVIAFTTSAFFTAYAGAMYIHFVKYAHPDTFTQTQSVRFLTMLLFGGTASIMGPITGSIAVMGLMELLRIEALRKLQDYQMFIYGILLLAVIVLIPGGLYKYLHDRVLKLYNQVKKVKDGEVANRA
ncbi:MAG: branched-chain amino acid ABC transporter permease [Saccharofermentanales bacterium]